MKQGAWRYTFSVDGALPGTQALQDLSETHSHRMVVTLVIVVLVSINSLYVSAQICPRWNPLTSWMRQIEDLQRAA